MNVPKAIRDQLNQSKVCQKNGVETPVKIGRDYLADRVVVLNRLETIFRNYAGNPIRRTLKVMMGQLLDCLMWLKWWKRFAPSGMPSVRY